MSLSTMRQRVSLLPSRPVSEPQSIRCLMRDLAGEINLRPVYQREIRWKKDNMCDLIKTVMEQGLIPGIIAYRLQAEEREEGSCFRYEMVDGQHRFFTLQKFFESKLVTEAGGKPFMITWIYRDATGRNTHIFYQKNSQTEEWEAQHRNTSFAYMTEDEKDAFNSFKIDVKEIKDPLTLDQRRAIFMSLQRGVPVRNSDYYKNKTTVPLIRFITDTLSLEGPMKDAIEKRCHLNAKSYWLNWVIRFFLILNPTDDKNEEEQFAVRDSAITKLMKDESPILESTDEQHEQLQAAVERFLAFLTSLSPSVKVPPCQFYALFSHLSSAEEGREDILRGHVNEWANRGLTKDMKRGWESKKVLDNDEERAVYYLELVSQLESIKTPAREPEARKSIPKKVRIQVWKRDFGDLEATGTCYCCNDEITFEGNYEAGHIIAHAQGGSDSADNLRPVCQCCNRSMYMQNMDEYKAQYF